MSVVSIVVVYWNLCFASPTPTTNWKKNMKSKFLLFWLLVNSSFLFWLRTLLTQTCSKFKVELRGWNSPVFSITFTETFPFKREYNNAGTFYHLHNREAGKKEMLTFNTIRKAKKISFYTIFSTNFTKRYFFYQVWWCVQQLWLTVCRHTIYRFIGDMLLGFKPFVARWRKWTSLQASKSVYKGFIPSFMWITAATSVMFSPSSWFVSHFWLLSECSAWCIYDLHIHKSGYCKFWIRRKALTQHSTNLFSFSFLFTFCFRSNGNMVGKWTPTSKLQGFCSD